MAGMRVVHVSLLARAEDLEHVPTLCPFIHIMYPPRTGRASRSQVVRSHLVHDAAMPRHPPIYPQESGKRSGSNDQDLDGFEVSVLSVAGSLLDVVVSLIGAGALCTVGDA